MAVSSSQRLECLRKIYERCPAVVSKCASVVVADTDKYVPWRTGWLKSHVRIDDSSAALTKKVVYYASYASECYYANHKFNPKRNALATARWFEASKADNLEAWRKTAAKELLG